MTENEALGYLKNSKRQKSMLEILPGSDIGNTIIKALEELKQYRTIGTPEECQKSVAVCKAMIARKITPENMEEYMKFEDECVKCGFTLKSLLEAREKQIPYKLSRKKLVWGATFRSRTFSYLPSAVIISRKRIVMIGARNITACHIWD